MDTSPLTRIPLGLAVSARLRDAIVSGSLSLGETLPTEEELSKMFAVSRPTIREAVRVLQVQGLVTGGDTVSTARPRVTHQLTTSYAATALSTALQVGAIPLEDLLELRVLLERAAIVDVRVVPGEAWAALETMEIACQRIDLTAFRDADADFHVALAGAGGNRVYGLVMAVLRDCIARYLTERLEAEEDHQGTLRHLLDEHRAIVDAVQAGHHRKAADLLERHVRDYYNKPQAGRRST